MSDWSVAAQAPSAAAPPPANPWAVVSHAPVGAEVQAQRTADARGETPVAHQEFWDSVNQTFLQPLVDQVKDVAARGGPAVTNELIQGFMDQLGEFAKSASTGLDLRKLPIIGTGAVSTTDRVK